MSDALPAWWLQIQSEQLRQGDLLTDCFVPLFHPDFGKAPEVTESVEVREYDCIVLTQSCDLNNQKAPLVAVCPVAKLIAYEQVDPRLAQKGEWEKVRQGRVEGLHLLASPTEPSNNRACLVVDFRQIYSLPVGYLQVLAGSLGSRWRLQSPFLEHLSQAFARFFMRVGFASGDSAFQEITSLDPRWQRNMESGNGSETQRAGELPLKEISPTSARWRQPRPAPPIDSA